MFITRCMGTPRAGRRGGGCTWCSTTGRWEEEDGRRQSGKRQETPRPQGHPQLGLRSSIPSIPAGQTALGSPSAETPQPDSPKPPPHHTEHPSPLLPMTGVPNTPKEGVPREGSAHWLGTGGHAVPTVLPPCSRRSTTLLSSSSPSMTSQRYLPSSCKRTSLTTSEASRRLAWWR